MYLPWPILVVLALLALTGLVTVWVALVNRRLRLSTDADEVHFPRAADGWRLALWRLRPRGAVRHPYPVVLFHGLWANRFNVHFDQRLSLGRHLAERGHDVFLAELRGSGRAAEPGPEGPHGRNAQDFAFDEHLDLDVPAHLQRVLEVTGAEKVFWVGHSMGGMLAYALSGTPWGRRLAGIVAVGSPMTWHHLSPVVLKAVRAGRPLARRGMRLRQALTVLAPLGGWIHPPGATLALNPRNMDGRVVRRALFNLVGDLSPGHVAQFSDWIRYDRFASRNGEVDYRASLRRSDVPMYFLAGAVDALAPPGAVKDAFEQAGTEDKRYEVLGEATGCVRDYGHGDLLLGRKAPEEVFPRITAWIDAHMPSAPAEPADAADAAEHHRQDAGAGPR